MNKEQVQNEQYDSANTLKEYRSIDQLIYRTNFIIGTGDEYNASVIRTLTQHAFSLSGVDGLVRFASHSKLVDLDFVLQAVVNSNDLNAIIYSALSIRGLDTTQLLISTIEKFKGGDDILYGFIQQYLATVMTLDMDRFTIFALANKDAEICTTLMLEVRTGKGAELAEIIRTSDRWDLMAEIKSRSPSIAYGMSDRLEETRESDKELIVKYITGVYKSAPAASQMHMDICLRLNNRLVEETFTSIHDKEAKRAQAFLDSGGKSTGDEDEVQADIASAIQDKPVVDGEDLNIAKGAITSNGVAVDDGDDAVNVYEDMASNMSNVDHTALDTIEDVFDELEEEGYTPS